MAHVAAGAALSVLLLRLLASSSVVRKDDDSGRAEEQQLATVRAQLDDCSVTVHQLNGGTAVDGHGGAHLGGDSVQVGDRVGQMNVSLVENVSLAKHSSTALVDQKDAAQ